MKQPTVTSISDTVRFITCPPLVDLHRKAVRILNVEARVDVLPGRRAAIEQVLRHRLAIEILDADREMIDDRLRAGAPQRYEGPLEAEPHDLVRLVLAQHRQAEHLLIEVCRPLQVADREGDVADESAP